MMTNQKRVDYKQTLSHLFRLLHFAGTMNELEDVDDDELYESFAKFINDLYSGL